MMPHHDCHMSSETVTCISGSAHSASVSIVLSHAQILPLITADYGWQIITDVGAHWTIKYRENSSHV